MTPYYQDDAVTIYHGDCLDVLPAINGVDLVFTSPPYNLGTSSGGGLPAASAARMRTDRALGSRGGNGKWSGGSLAGGYESYGDNLPHDEYVTWQKDVLRACWDTLSTAGAIFYNHKPRIFDGILVSPFDYNPDLPVRQVVIWARAGGINFSPSFYCPTHEWIVVLARPDFRLKSKGASGIGDVWYVPQESGTEHPAPFPIGLPARAIETTAPRLVLDPFMGSGTTLKAAKSAGVRAIGIEIEERYCEISAKLCSQEVFDFNADVQR